MTTINEITEELTLLHERQKTYADDYRRALKIQALRLKVSEKALGQYVKAVSQDTQMILQFEVDDLQALLAGKVEVPPNESEQDDESDSVTPFRASQA